MRSWGITFTAGIALALLPALGAAQGMGSIRYPSTGDNRTNDPSYQEAFRFGC